MASPDGRSHRVSLRSTQTRGPPPPPDSCWHKCVDLLCKSAALVTIAAVSLVSLITWPIYYITQQPWVTLDRARRKRATRENLADPSSAYYRIGQQYSFYLGEIDTIPEAQKQGLVRLEPNKRAIGFREVLEVKQVYSKKEGKNLHKYVLSDYNWLSLAEVDEHITVLERALRSLGVQNGHRVLIYAETRYEWFLCAHAVIRIGAAVVTLYPTLGEEGLRYGIEETKVSVVITSESLLGKVPKSLPATVAHLIYLATLSAFTSTPKAVEQLSRSNPAVTFHSYAQLITRGQSAKVEQMYDRSSSAITPDTPAVILYTSGSTGQPKGVVLTHRNFVNTVKSVFTIISEQIVEDHDHHCWYGFLPLAHILEFIAENTLFCSGIKLGYGSPYTMTDLSTGIIHGQPGDLTLLKPTIVPGVPLVLERIRKTIQEKLERRTKYFCYLADYLTDYKHFWLENGYQTPLFDRLVCGRFKKLFGGNIEYMLIGGAPLSGDTQKLTRALLGVKILIGFGSTETCGANMVMDLEDLSISFTGAPLFGIKARLVDWIEGGYTTNDRPNPRGELHIGGDSVSPGYFNRDQLTAEAFYQENGVQWFRTGDIAEVDESIGLFRVIDRKKDLVKLQNGEYVSLGRIESELKNALVVDNVCVHGDSKHTFVVALIMPNKTELKKLALTFLNQPPVTGGQSSSSSSWSSSARSTSVSATSEVTEVTDEMLEQLRTDAAFVESVTVTIEEFCRKQTHLSKVEIPERVYLCKEDWTVESIGLLTATAKLKRHNITRFYAKQIDQMYQQ